MQIDNVRLCVDQAINLSPMRLNGYDLDRIPCDHRFVSETFDHDELLYRYACQAQDSSTPSTVFKLLLRWLPSDFILRHRLTLDENMTFMLAYDVYHTMKDSYPEVKRYKARPGKFMSKLGRGPHFCQAFAEEWAEVILPLKNKLDGYKIRVLESTDDIVDAYMSFSGELDSCLCYELERYSTDGIHPAVVYGGESNVHMAVVSHKDRQGNDHDISRTLIYNKSYVKIYPACDTSVCQTTKVLLKDRGIANGTTDLDGAKLNLVYTERGNVVCPYLDGKSCVEISTGVGHINEVGEDIKPRKYLQVGDTGFDTTQSSYYEVAAFDPETYRMPESPDHVCRNCSSDVYTDSDSLRYNANWDWHDNIVFCSEECMLEYGHVYAYVSKHDMGWVHSEDCQMYGDNWYFDDAFEEHDLVITDDGELQRKDECMNLGNVWFLLSDLNAELLLCMSKLYPHDDYITEMYELYKEKD